MKNLFEEMIGTPPPSNVDIRSIVVRQDRLMRTRRAIAIAAGFAVLAGTVGFGISMRPNASDGVIPGESPSVTASPAAETAEQKAARVEAAWQRAVAKHMPGAQWRYHLDARFFPAGYEGPNYADTFKPEPPVLNTQTNSSSDDPWAIVPWHTSDTQYGVSSIVRVNGVTGNIYFGTQWRAKDSYPYKCTTADGITTCPEDERCAPDQQCHRSTGPHGEVLFITRKRDESIAEFTHAQIWLTVWMRSADGARIASLEVYNRPGDDSFPGPVTEDLPLTEQQLIDMLLEPGLLI